MTHELEYWDEIQGIGVLNMEMELVVGVEPVLFVCSLKSNPKKKYLIMTYNSMKGKYVIREIGNEEVLLMLDNEITMEQTFRNGTYIYLTYLEEGLLKFEKHKSSDFDGTMLPKKGAYYNIRSKYILDYKKELKTKTFTFDLRDTNYSTDRTESYLDFISSDISDKWFESIVLINGKKEKVYCDSSQKSSSYSVYNNGFVA